MVEQMENGEGALLELLEQIAKEYVNTFDLGVG